MQLSSETTEAIVKEPNLDDDSEGHGTELVHQSRPTYQMRPSSTDVFQSDKIRLIINEVMSVKLKGKTYNMEEAGTLTKEIADEVNALVKDQGLMPRFKHIVQVIISQQFGSGCKYIARCLWDAESDSYVSELFTNASLFCVCTVFGVYQY